MGATIHGRRLVPLRGTVTLCLHRNSLCNENLYEREMITMITIEGLIAVVSLVITAFSLGYTIGSNKTQK